MKIIAQIDRETYILEATQDEIAKCAGYYYHSSMPTAKKIEIGSVVDVTEAYATCRALVESSQELKEAKAKVEKTVAAITAFQSVLDPKVANIKTKIPS